MESLDARVDFSERRARALEGAVIYRPQIEPEREAPRPAPIAPPERSPARAPVLARSSRSGQFLRFSCPWRPGPRLWPCAGPGRGKLRSAQQAASPPARPAWRGSRRFRHGLACGLATGIGTARARGPWRARERLAGVGLRIRRRHHLGLRSVDKLRARRSRRRAVKLAVVVQRYGQAINGGAELHARYIAEHLARHAEVDVLTTYASDYITWRNEPGPAQERINGIPVRRFPVEHERDLLAFSRQSAHVFRNQHSLADELRWLDAEGPDEPCAREPHRRARRVVRFLPVLQLSVLPGVSRCARGGQPCGPRADGGARSGDRAGTVSAALSRRPRPDVQLAGRAGDDPGRLEQPRCAGRRRGHRVGSATGPGAAAVSAEVRRSRTIRHLRRPHRREQGLQGAVRVLRSDMCATSTGSCRSCWSVNRCCRLRRIHASATSVSSTTPTSSTRWRPPIC